MDRAGLAFWESLSTAFRFQPPLSPAPEDIDWLAAHARACLDGAPKTALLLGVTPAIAAMPLPDGARLVAVDWSTGMIRNVFPRAARSAAVRGDWRELPLADASCAAAFGDFLFPALPTRDDAALALSEIARALAPGGVLCVRCFLRTGEAADEVAQDAASPELVHLRFAAALQGAAAAGPLLDDVARAWERTGRELPAPLARWRGRRMRYWFATLEELVALAGKRFEVLDLAYPPYVAGRRIVRLALRRR